MWVPGVGRYTRMQAGATSQAAPENKPQGHRNAGVIDRHRDRVVDWFSHQIAHAQAGGACDQSGCPALSGNHSAQII